MKILVLKFRNIGDVLLVSPLLSNLKFYYEKSSIDIAVNKGTEAMVEGNPDINKVIIYDRERIKYLTIFNKIWNEFNFLWGFRKKKYDLVINLTEGDRGTQIALLSKAPVRIGYHNQNKIFKNAFTHHMPKQGKRHTIEANLDPLRVLNIPIKHKKVKIYWDKVDTEIIESKLLNIDQFIHIHPVSRWLFKCLSNQLMAKIIDYCEVELNIKVIITAAPVQEELDKVSSILSLCKSKPINLSGELSLKQTAVLNNKAKLFIGIDTAIMHISAANNTPVLSFFGPSGANHWGPWDNNLMESGYTNKNGVQSMGIHRVISESRACQPCGKDGCAGTKISDCLMEINFETITRYIDRAFDLR